MAEHLTAVIDLGSNSFHLLLARERDGEWVPLERVKEKVQLGRGLADGQLSSEAQERGLASLARFAQRLKAVPRQRRLVVGTAAFRQACNRDDFLAEARRRLDADIDVLTGDAEAELIYLGVTRDLAMQGRRRLVIDIGGGSTELALGADNRPDRVQSLNIGCVSLSDEHFQPGADLPAGFTAARRATRAHFEAELGSWSSEHWDEVIVTSGTAESVQSVLTAHGWADDAITRAGLDELCEAMIQPGWMTDFGLPGLPPERADIFPAGLAIMAALFDSLLIQRAHFTSATLLDGLLFEELEDSSPANLQARTVENWRRRYHADPDQVRRVKTLALKLLDDVAGPWNLPREAAAELLGWAADLHEIGFDVSSRQPQRHAAYLIQNGDMPGFLPDQQRALALLVRCHRGPVPAFAFGAYPAGQALMLQRVVAVLRAAVILNRSRTDADVPVVQAMTDAELFRLRLPGNWLADHALSQDELEREQDRVAALAVRLELAIDDQ